MASAASNVDPDIAAAFSGQSSDAPPSAAIDPDIAEAFKSNVPAKIDKGPDIDFANAPKRLLNVVKDAVSPLVHGAGTLADVATGTSPGPGSHAERWSAPFQKAPDPWDNLAGDPQAWNKEVSQTYDKVAGTGPLAQTLKERIPQAAEAVGTATGLAGRPMLAPEGVNPAPLTAEQAVTNTASRSKGNMGAAASGLDLSAAPEPIRQEIAAAAQKNGGVIPNPEAAQNHIDAGKFGIDLTKGQATQDPMQYTAERNSPNPQIRARFNTQEQQMTDAIDNVRREAAPTAVANNPIENGQITLDDLKAHDAPIKQDITSAYNAAKAASATGDLQLNGKAVIDQASAALKPQSKFRFLPSTVQGIMDDVSESGGKLTLDDHQAYTTQLGAEIAKAQRAGDGNAVAAIKAVKNAFDNAEPLSNETAQAKSLYDVARGKAKARFDAMDASPAYEAAVNDDAKTGAPSPLADTFIDKYFLGKGAPKAYVDNTMQMLGPDGKEAVAAHTLSNIRNQAVTNNGTVTPSGFSGALNKYGPKLDSLLPKGTPENLSDLAGVIQKAKVAPAGHQVNSSNSGVLVNAAKGLGSAYVQGKTLGLGIPILKGVMDEKFAADALKPGAGIDTPK